ncbi:MAG: protease modulator HflC [Candidatus Paracaedibacteraceae bacterium]|nr:protease modulator HflC [Candidatus Paracaedibacteraceae bacterium]
MSPRSLLLMLSAAAGVFVFNSSVFIVDQVHQAVVLQFGEAKEPVHNTPGLKFKLPFIQEVTYYEKRIIDYDSDPISVMTVDQKRLNVDAYVRYRIIDALAFFRSVSPSNEKGARMRLDAIVSSSIKNVLGKVELGKLLSSERVSIMKQIKEEVTILSKSLGLEIVDVRIIRTELPTENRPAVFDRMNSILIRTAKQNRAEGDEKARGIRANAERERAVLLAEAQQKAQGIRGKGDASAMEITNKAFGVDIEFYNFYRSLESYRQTMQSETSMVLSSEHPYLAHLSHAAKSHH